MGAIFLSDFKYGMDRRRKRVAGTPGTLWTGENVVITRGGDIERAKRFVPIFTLPASQTFGLAEVRGQIWTFGSTPAAAVPLGINYMQLVAPSGAAMTQILDARASNGKLYVIARYADGNIFHFYDGARVTDWDTVADGGFTYAILADYLASLINTDAAVSAISVNNVISITARVAGTAFTVTKSTTDNGGTSDQDITLATPQANVPAVAEVRASTVATLISGTAGSITSFKINAVEMLYATVAWAGSLAATATALAQSINNKSLTTGYTATVASNAVTVTAAVGTGATPNGFVVAVVQTGDLNISAPNISGGVTAAAGTAQVTTGTLIGTPEAKDSFTLTVNGIPYTAVGRAAATGNSIFVASRRIFSTAGSLVEWSTLISATNPNGATDWHSNSGLATGTGFINVSNDAEGSERLLGCGRYMLNQMAAMTRRNIRVYNLDTDATKIGLIQPVDNTGTRAARSILGFGSVDLFYLSDSGIRSLRPRDTTNAAFVDDIGTPIDTFVRDHMDSLSDGVITRAVAAMEPRDDRYMLSLDSRVYVLSYFPGAQISAWTYFSPGFQITDWARVYDRLYARAGDTIYLYGGTTGTTYPNAGEMVATVKLPFIANTPPGKFKLDGFDQAGEGEWQVQLAVDPDNEAALVNIGVLDHITYGQDDINVPGRATHVAPEFVCSTAGYASLSNVAIYDSSKETGS